MITRDSISRRVYYVKIARTSRSFRPAMSLGGRTRFNSIGRSCSFLTGEPVGPFSRQHSAMLVLLGPFLFRSNRAKLTVW